MFIININSNITVYVLGIYMKSEVNLRQIEVSMCFGKNSVYMIIHCGQALQYSL